MNYFIFTILTGINAISNIVFVIYILAFSFQSNVWNSYLKEYWWVSLIALVIILVIPADDLLRTILNLPPEPIK